MSCSSNMLYPAEDREHSQLRYACKTCDFTTLAKEPTVYRNDLSVAAGNTAGTTQDIQQDPTVNNYPSFLCTVCAKEITCVKCGKPTYPGTWLEVVDQDDETTADSPIADTIMDMDDYDDIFVSDPESDDEDDGFDSFQEFINGLGNLNVSQIGTTPQIQAQNQQQPQSQLGKPEG
jgi:DNA-directed RNA polymerase subunit M/transcription elongation factor TFIIS